MQKRNRTIDRPEIRYLSYHLSHLKNDKRFVESDKEQFKSQDNSGRHGCRVSHLRPITSSFMIRNESVRPPRHICIHAPNIWSRGDPKTDDLFLVFLISRFIQAHRHERMTSYMFHFLHFLSIFAQSIDRQKYACKHNMRCVPFRYSGFPDFMIGTKYNPHRHLFC